MTDTALSPPPTAARASDVVIRTRGLVRDFGSVRAVDGVDLTVQRGRTLALLGASGCGKTTTLRLLAGFERPDAGSVEIDGRIVASDATWVAPEHRSVGMVFQDYALFPHLSVASNVAYGLAGGRRRRDKAARAERVSEMLELVGLTACANRLPHQLSGGQQQRVALARALAPRPAVVLLDEPFSNLDAALRARVRAEVTAILRAAEATAVFVTHDQEEALAIADEVAVIRAGRVAQHATPEQLYRTPSDRAVAAFVGEAEFFPGLATGATAATELGHLQLVRPASGAVDVLVRPEELMLHRDPAGHGEVVAREFYGHDQTLFVRLADNGRVVRVRLGPLTDLAPGDRCRLTVPGRALAYPRQ